MSLLGFAKTSCCICLEAAARVCPDDSHRHSQGSHCQSQWPHVGLHQNNSRSCTKRLLQAMMKLHRSHRPNHSRSAR